VKGTKEDVGADEEENEDIAEKAGTWVFEESNHMGVEDGARRCSRLELIWCNWEGCIQTWILLSLDGQTSKEISNPPRALIAWEWTSSLRGDEEPTLEEILPRSAKPRFITAPPSGCGVHSNSLGIIEV